MTEAGEPTARPQLYYSQHGEDFLLHELFAGRENGFYVDIGAFDGIHLSNSYVFEQLGWRGICVEAHPRYAPICQQNRPGAICVESAIVGAGFGKTVPFFSEELGLLSGIKSDQTRNMVRWYARRGMVFKGFDRVMVPATTLNKLLIEHGPADKQIDFISIDTEGNEAEILEVFAAKRWRPRVVLVEANGEAAKEKLVVLFSRHGYQLARHLACNLFFADHADDVTFLRHKHIDCEIANTLHPAGEPATAEQHRGRHIKGQEGWLCENVLEQAADQPLHTLFDQFDPAWSRDVTGLGVVHAVNLFAASGEAAETQTRTVEAMKTAAAAASDSAGTKVTFLSVQAADDPVQPPQGFERSRDLDRSVLDIEPFSPPRPLPLLFDILDRAVERADPDDLVVFTNSDICLSPHFYLAIQELAGAGFDAIVVNRRTIGPISAFERLPNLRAAEVGAEHPGFDCFAFRRSLYDRFVKTLSCVGIRYVALALFYNLVARAERMIILQNVALTCHYGNDQTWKDTRYAGYTAHNESEMIQHAATLSQDAKAASRLAEFFSNHKGPREVKALFAGADGQ